MPPPAPRLTGTQQIYSCEEDALMVIMHCPTKKVRHTWWYKTYWPPRRRTDGGTHKNISCAEWKMKDEMTMH